ncbi:CapA family protein [Streptomyces sp. NPDC008001]|uniref:CapA family protein n=1 Tax=Streptomyces sp. NPDC008001 TaxID=3364804 RepID=UPI0036F111ED
MKLALAGDTMLGREVAGRLATVPPESLFADEVVAAAHEADLFVLNLECAVSARGERRHDPFKPFFFRAPPVAVRALQHLGVDCVNLANNHALDYGPDALLDTVRHLAGAGIASTGAGRDEEAARRPAVVEHRGLRLGVVGVTDHPEDFAAGPDRPGVAYARLEAGAPAGLLRTVTGLGTDITLVTPHWGPNMTRGPSAYIRRAAQQFLAAGATLVAGHSAHVFHGVADRVLYDLGDFIDDYATDDELRNDLGLLFLVTFDGPRPVRVEGVPLALDFCRTRLAGAAEARWIAHRFRQACAAFGTEVTEEGGRLVVEWSGPPEQAQRQPDE